eukprot:scaffold9754_cov97-Skeletonema_dohrnii-CCMP3373.AAC.2
MEEADHSVVDQRGRTSATTTTENERSHHRRPNRRPPSATSKTPRRRNTNPQSSSPPRRRRDDDDDTNIKDGITNHITNDDIINNDKEPPPSSSSPLATPLTTLTTLLQTSHIHQQTLLTLFRTSHSLHLHAIDRKTKAIEALRLAQAELEHATTAEEFAKVELQRSKLTKDGACGRHDVLRGEVTKLSSGYNGVRVALVNLTSNSNWNGRCGTIVKMIVEGEDLGRWKVRLDSDWRGKEPDGNYSVGSGGGGGEEMLSQDWEHVVAKAENLKLIDGGGDVPSFLGGGRSQQQQVDGSDVAKSRSSSRSSSRSPSSRDEDGKGKHHPLDPVEELPEESYNHNIVTPERRGGRRRIYNNNNNNHQPSSPPQQHGDEYDWKRNALGSQHSPPGYYEPDDHHHQFVHHRHAAAAAPVMHHHHSQLQKRQEEPPQQKQQLQRIHGHRHQQPTQKQQQKHYVSPRAPKRSPKSSPNMQQQQQQMYNRNQVSSFSEMVSPESFAPISFQIETSESFSQRDAVLPPSSSFFEEATPREDTQHVPNHQHHGYQEESNEERSKTSAHSSLQATAAHSNSLPTVVVLPVDDEDEGNRNAPPTCVGVQNAGISHVNGLYVLAPNNHQDDEEEESSQPNSSNNNADVPPLYFRDAEPILLSDKRYYDMCILRIDCPDSPEYVIWFLSRVDIDPDCLDVKFSDCYYYCRVLRSVGLYVPPMDGWSVPDVQQQQEQQPDGDDVAFTTVDDEASFVNDQERLHSSSMSSGLGIVPRSAENDYV